MQTIQGIHLVLTFVMTYWRGANLSIYDPKVDSDQIAKDLNLNVEKKVKIKVVGNFVILEESALIVMQF